jgi:SAM-dependent methyltransferase
MSPSRDTQTIENAKELLLQEDGTLRFESLYAGVERDSARVPWQRNYPQPLLRSWVEETQFSGQGRLALVVGSGLGDDSEYLSELGFQVRAFDISPSAIAWCQELHPQSSVDYQVGDLLNPPVAWSRSFDLVFESLTLQSLPEGPRAQAFSPLADFVAPGGDLLVVARGRDPDDPNPGPPWALVRAEMNRFVEFGLKEIRFDDLPLGMRRGRAFRALYRRPA